MVDPRTQRSYFEKARYRAPTSQAVRAYTAPKIGFLEQIFQLSRSARVLEVACGSGVFTEPLARLFDGLVCVDFAHGMLADCPSGLRCQADALTLPFSDETFDLVIEANLLHHVAEPSRVVREMARVSKRRVVMIEPNAANPLMWAYGAIRAVERGTLRFHRSYMRRLATAEGLAVREHFSTGMITQNLTPGFLVPILKLFDGRFPFGMYQMAFLERSVDT